MTNHEIIADITNRIKSNFEGDASGHDWFHIERVLKTAEAIAKKEKGADLFITQLGALLHDIADHKFVENHELESVKRVTEILSKYENISPHQIQSVIHIVLHCSFKGGVDKNKMESLEGKIVQDADKLDAIGAIGVARAFAFGGKFGSILYDPEIPPMKHKDLKSYQKNRSHTINHFYEKLLLLKDLMNTESGKKMAEQKHDFMTLFLNQFYNEWNANL